MRTGVDVAAGNAIKAFLVSKKSELVSGLTSNGVSIRVPRITTAPATPPDDAGPFIAINVFGRDIAFNAGNAVVSIGGSNFKIDIFLRNHMEPEIDDDELYEQGNNNHLNIGDRIVAQLLTKFKDDRSITDPNTGFMFKLNTSSEMNKVNSGAGWGKSDPYVVAVSEISFQMRSQCEETLY